MFKNRVDGVEENDQLDLILPEFVLCLRDFTLQLVKDGKKITEDEYLEETLELKPANSEENIKFNRPKLSIRKYFPVRKCFTFDVPGNRNQINMLDNMALNQLSETFQEDTEKFLKHMYNRKPKVLIRSKPINGEMFSSLVETYVNAIKDGGVPDVDDAMTTVAKLENERLSKHFIQQFREQLEVAHLPQLNTKEFNDLFHRYKEQTLENFREEAMDDAEDFELRLIDALDNIFRGKKEENLELVKKHCKDELERLYKEHVGDQPDKYHHAGGYSEYKLNMGKVKVAYKKNFIHTEESTVQEVMNNFLNSETEVENHIMLSDQKLSTDERKKEIERIQKEYAEAQKLQKEEFERERQEDQKRNDEHMKRVEAERAEFKKHEDEMNKMLQEEWAQRREMIEKQIQIMANGEKLEQHRKMNQIEEQLQREKQKRKRLEDKLEQKEKHGCSLM